VPQDAIIEISNNIFEQNTKCDLQFLWGGMGKPQPLSSYYLENNVMEKPIKCPNCTRYIYQTENVFSADPKFIDPQNLNFYLASGSPFVDAGKLGMYRVLYYDPYDKVKYPVPDPNTTPALPPSKGTIRNDIGAYGGPHAGVIGFVMPTEDDPSTPLIREDVIGTY